MLTRGTIKEYHAKTGVVRNTHKIGIELELFCIDNHTFKPLPYQTTDGHLSVQTLFDYLKTHEGYEEIGTSKTFELKKGGSKISLEPGAQIEFCSTPHHNLGELLQELWTYFDVLRKLSDKFNVSWLDVSYFPVGSPADVPLLPSARCEIIDRYWQHTGRLGRDLMRYTTSLHVSFDYDNLPDLARKVERALFLKPILLFMTASSRIRRGADTGLRSFRTRIYQDTDLPRTGTPGPESFWCSGQWSLDGYIEKVLRAPAIFAVGTGIGTYRESSHEPFEAYLNDANFDDYLSHLATMYTDIRVRQYLEVRYLDNPGIRLLPGIVILLHTLLHDDAAWNDLKGRIPYVFHEVPNLVVLLNAVTEASDSYWECQLRQPVKDFLLTLQRHIEPALAEFLEDVLERVVDYKSRDILPDMRSDESIIAHFKDAFPF